MKFKADVEKFGHAFAACAAARSSRTPIEELQAVHVSVAEGVARLTASDAENTIVMDVEVESEEPGCVLLPANSLIAILRECTADQIELSVSGSEIKVLAGKAGFKLPSADVDRFPLPSHVEGTSVVVDAADFQSALRKTVFATEPNSSRFSLGGVRIEKSDDGLLFVATDGRRLSRVLLGATGEIADCTVPTRAAALMQKADLTGEVTITTDPSSIRVTASGICIFSRLLEGRFPSWRQVIPELSGLNKVLLKSSDLSRGIRQASIVVDKETRGIKFHFDNGMLSLSSSAAERGSATIDIRAEYLGEPVTMKLDYVFVMDFLRSLDDEVDLTVYLGDKRQSVIFDDGHEAIYTIMAMGDQ
jgi:DNA polymerase-3 subunit beta